MEAGATMALIRTGNASPEISQRKAEKIYGKWFTDAVKRGRLTPCRTGEGAHGTRWFSVNEILAYELTEITRAEVIFK